MPLFTDRSYSVLVSGKIPSLEQVVFKNASHGGDTILPADFFSFFVRPAGIGNADFIYFYIQLGYLGSNLWFEAKTVFFDLYLLKNIPAEYFVAGFHIGQVQVCQHIGEEGQKGVSKHVPEVENPAVITGDKARTVHYIGLALKNRLNQLRILLRVIFQVGVLDYDHVAGCLPETGTEGCTLSLVSLMKKDSYRIAGHCPENLAGSIGGAIVNDNDFFVQSNSFDSGADLPDGLFFVVDWNDNG